MFFVLSKILSFLLSPLVWVVILLTIVMFTKNKFLKHRLFVTAAAILIFFSNTFLFDEVMRQWELPVVKTTNTTMHYDAAIVLSGMMVYDVQMDRMQFNRRNDRLIQALDLYHKKIIDKIILSGGSGSLTNRTNKESVLIKKFLVESGYPDSVIIVESKSDNTNENARFTAEIIQRKFVDGKFLLITSASHLPRAIACFKKYGIKAHPYSSDRYSGPRKFVFDHCFIPNAETLMNWEVLLHEWVGCIIYSITGKI